MLYAKVLDLTNKVDDTWSTLRDIANQSYQILKPSNENLKALTNRLEGTRLENMMIIVEEGGFWVETKGLGKRARANKKKKASEYNNELAEIKEATWKVDMLEKEAMNLLMNMD